MTNRFVEKANEDIKKSLEDKIASIVESGVRTKAKNEKEIDRLTKRNTAIDKNIEELTTAYDEGKFIDTNDIVNFVAVQSGNMDAIDGVSAGTAGNGTKLRL